MNAYTEPRITRPGCQHNLGCKCQVPYHLRPSTIEELIHEERYNSPLKMPIQMMQLEDL